MNSQITRTLVRLLPLVLISSACIFTSPVLPGRPAPTIAPGPQGTPVPPATVTITATITPTPSPTIPAGGMGDFSGFAAGIADAIQQKDAGFFGRIAAPSDWNCLGDETAGVCKGRPAGAALQGIPVTTDWASYKLYKAADYAHIWQTAFTRGDALKLVALANQFGDNPLMPLADQAFIAVIAVGGKGVQAPVRQVHILYFEYNGPAWQLMGELVTTAHTPDWITNTCPTCYDTWASWPN